MGLERLDKHTLREEVARDRMNLISDVVKISQTPAPTFHERDRAEVLAARFEELRVDDVYIDPAGNVVAHRKSRDVPPICVNAHLDTVFDSSVNHTAHVDDRVITGPGVGDDSLGLATLLSIVRLLPEEKPGNLIFLASSGTEGQGNLRGSRYFVEKLERDLGCTVCLEGHDLGRIDYWSLGTIRLHVTAESQGGHIWRDDVGENPVRVVSDLVTRLYELQEEYNDSDKYAAINAGRLEGGATFNTVPYDCELDVEIRSDDRQLMNKLNSRVKQLIEDSKVHSTVSLTVEEVTRRPVSGLDEGHWLIEEIEKTHDELGLRSQKGPASSDGCVFIDNGIPAVTLGLARGHRQHHEDESIEISSLESGQLQVMLSLLACGRYLNESQA